jgi:membrane protein DedA with SNARE-associated domain
LITRTGVEKARYGLRPSTRTPNAPAGLGSGSRSELRPAVRVRVIASLGPLRVFPLMVPESAGVPVPSEVTLMSAGFAVHRGWFGFPMAVAAATAGNLVGSLFAYWVGRSGAPAQLSKPVRTQLASCERVFARRGEWAVFIARLLPLARIFVSLPAGHARVPLVRFVVLTVAGCAMWSAGFVMAGLLAGAGWRAAAGIAGRIGLIGAVTLVLAVAWQMARRG